MKALEPPEESPRLDVKADQWSLSVDVEITERQVAATSIRSEEVTEDHPVPDLVESLMDDASVGECLYVERDVGVELDIADHSARTSDEARSIARAVPAS